MRSDGERSRALKRSVSSFNSSVADFQGKGSIAIAENAEVVDDMSGSGAEAKAISDPGQRQRCNRSFAGAWKPVIDGKVQFPDDHSTPSNITNWTSELGTTTNTSSSKMQPAGLERPSVSNVSSSDIKKDDEGNDSDSEVRRVPELPEKSIYKLRLQKNGGSSSRKRSGASSTDKEGKRLKRLLRNRVSAQQARERKKAYLVELEHKAKELESRNAELEEKNATLQRENYMLRQIVKNTTMRGGGGGGDLASS